MELEYTVFIILLHVLSFPTMGFSRNLELRNEAEIVLSQKIILLDQGITQNTSLKEDSKNIQKNELIAKSAARSMRNPPNENQGEIIKSTLLILKTIKIQ